MGLETAEAGSGKDPPGTRMESRNGTEVGTNFSPHPCWKLHSVCFEICKFAREMAAAGSGDRRKMPPCDCLYLRRIEQTSPLIQSL